MGGLTLTASDASGPDGNYIAHGLLLQPEGRLIVFGTEDRNQGTNPNPLMSNALLVGFNSTGLSDGSFGVGGKVRIFADAASTVHDALVQPDGMMLVAVSDLAGSDRIMRLMPNGATDTSFGDAGILKSPLMPVMSSITLQA